MKEIINYIDFNYILSTYTFVQEFCISGVDRDVSKACESRPVVRE